MQNKEKDWKAKEVRNHCSESGTRAAVKGLKIKEEAQESGQSPQEMWLKELTGNCKTFFFLGF